MQSPQAASWVFPDAKAPGASESQPPAFRPGRPGRFRRASVKSIAAVAVALLALWFAIHRISWLGPVLADGLRAVIGTEAVTRLEEWAYGAQDRFNRSWRRRQPPKAYWGVPSGQPSGRAPETIPSAEPSRETSRVFAPPNVGPFDASVTAPGDGVWVLVQDSERPAALPIVYKTLLHPDRKRPWAELFLVALDLKQIDVYAVAGTVDPESTTPQGRVYVRSGLVPIEHQSQLVIAFNGGFKTEHGHHGMRVDGVTLVPPRPQMCTFAAYSDGSVRIASWNDIVPSENDLRWWRQTPPCMVTAGRLHPGLTDTVTSWGAALGGDTVIRRSAVGLSSDATVLYVGIANATTARSIAEGMRHAGGHHVAQLDVNWSYPKIVTFRRGASGELAASGLFSGFVFHPDEGLRKRSPRDFFYVVRRHANSAPGRH